MASSSLRPGSSSNQATVLPLNLNPYRYSNKRECKVRKKISSSTNCRVRSQPLMLKLGVTASSNNKCQRLSHLAVWLKTKKLILKTLHQNSSHTLISRTSRCRRRLIKWGLCWTGRHSKTRRRQLNSRLYWRAISWETLKSKDLNARSWGLEQTHKRHSSHNTRR